jgi:ABC-2 type transport system ATP-binding protein
MNNFILEVKNVTKSFGNFKAIDNVSINIKEGSVFGLLGPNGAGKTTLIRTINQIFLPDEGEILLDGKPITFEDVKYFGYLPEERGLYRKMKVGEQAIYLAQLKGLDYNTAVKEIKRWFEKFEISHWWNKKVEELSKGMQQKIQFIITVLHKPKILIFDEPFSGFDPINANLLKNEILNLKKEGATIIFSTHNMESVEEICEDIALINKSQKILDGSISNIKNEFKEDIFLVKYLGQLEKEKFNSNFWEILDYHSDEKTTEIKVKLIDKNISHNKLLSLLMQRGELISFNEILPTMNEIFIKVVEQKNNRKDE